MSTSCASVPSSISCLQIEHFMEVTMATAPMTEAQGNEIIELLGKIVDRLGDIKWTAECSEKTLDSMQRELSRLK